MPSAESVAVSTGQMLPAVNTFTNPLTSCQPAAWSSSLLTDSMT